ncbi:hypothetical protein GGI25_002710 [Coemansia spiralis]|uniref:Uncharacterized protein n=2 Tax=Coemansia TaxID=4863 RepID=A0A9W8G396_9FUNG|nr:hypothetical protein EDC05_002169 [Coemansia umbellata]KAJ2625215.1 hypothetical protein GGI26_000684 [Coemansia sp. RSA 1358]KAJ2677921.1 hypothetical protein GGI25_002710 [Coemansia spiralis]
MGISKNKQFKGGQFLKRIHNATDVTKKSSDGSLQPYYPAAAEDDKLGWEVGEDRIDPMYTMRRREREQNTQAKTSFFKRLKTRTEGQGDTDMSDESKKEAATTVQSGELSTASKAPVPGIMRFGFGMMAAKLPATPSDQKSKDKDKAKKSKKKDKKHKKRKKDE